MKLGVLCASYIGAVIIFATLATSLMTVNRFQAVKKFKKLRSVPAPRMAVTTPPIERSNVSSLNGGLSSDDSNLVGCEEIYLPMCKGLVPYTFTRLPNRMNHTSQMMVYRELEGIWKYMDHSCSKNLRLMICSIYLPKCDLRHKMMGPCQSVCYQARKKCAMPLKKSYGLNWNDHFSCANLPNLNCLQPVKEGKCYFRRTTCVDNSVISICSNVTFAWGILPNKLGQCSIDELNTEIQQFDALIATNCHQSLNFLICGVYSPFCIRNDNRPSFPCHDICEEIREDCEPHYRRLYNNLPWPQKLECQSYPVGDNTECVMPSEGGSTFFQA